MGLFQPSAQPACFVFCIRKVCFEPLAGFKAFSLEYGVVESIELFPKEEKEELRSH